MKGINFTQIFFCKGKGGVLMLDLIFEHNCMQITERYSDKKFKGGGYNLSKTLCKVKEVGNPFPHLEGESIIIFET